MIPKIELRYATDDPVAQDLATRYWQLGEHGRFVESVASLAVQFGIPKGQVAARVSAACLAYVAEDSCPQCDVPKPLNSRAAFEQTAERLRWRSASSSICSTCQAAQRAQQEQVAAQATAERQAILWDAFNEIPGVTIEQLSLMDAVYLLAVSRAGGADDMSYIAPRRAFREALSPTERFDREILIHLYRQGILAVHPGSRSETVVIDNGKFTKFTTFDVHWLMRVQGVSPAKFIEMVDALVSGDEWPGSWWEEVAALHTRVALEECTQYYEVAVGEHGFDGQPSPKGIAALKSALRYYSIGQVYSFIWRAAKDAAAFFMREATSRAHAANIIPGAIQRMFERARAEGWSVTIYRRDRRAPESVLSHVLFTTALKLKDGGLSTVAPAADEDPQDNPVQPD